jgi:hypothetical protein
MDTTIETRRSGGLGTTVITPEVVWPPGQSDTAPSPCRWPSLAIEQMRMRDLDAALAADPLFHLCPDGDEGQVDVRYWYFHPLNLSCRHCSEGGGICVVEPATVICRHRIARRSGQHIRER